MLRFICPINIIDNVSFIDISVIFFPIKYLSIIFIIINKYLSIIFIIIKFKLISPKFFSMLYYKNDFIKKIINLKIL